MILAQGEFSYNNYVDRSTGKTPFEMFCGIKPRGVSDLKDVVFDEEKRIVEGELFSKYMISLYKEVQLRMKQSNQKYKENADKSRRHQYFEVGDEVMVHLKKG